MKILYTLLFIVLATQCFSQEYSYISDRKFNNSEYLLGYEFRPSKIIHMDTTETALNAGSYSFKIDARNIIVKGEGIAGQYSFSHITPTEYGYKIFHRNLLNSLVKGHIKVILNSKYQAQALIFRRSPKDPEIIFELPRLTDSQVIHEQNYFTDIRDLRIEHSDSIWGERIYPFFELKGRNGEQKRLFQSDNVFIDFEKLIHVEEKVKKVAFSKVKQMVNKGEEQETERIKQKITETYFFNFKSNMRNAEGRREFKTKRYEIAEVITHENPNSKKKRYQLEFVNKYKVPIVIDLDINRNVRSMLIEGEIYRMRGF